jgi:hypothetical protein
VKERGVLKKVFQKPIKKQIMLLFLPVVIAAVLVIGLFAYFFETNNIKKKCLFSHAEHGEPDLGSAQRQNDDCLCADDQSVGQSGGQHSFAQRELFRRGLQQPDDLLQQHGRDLPQL